MTPKSKIRELKKLSLRKLFICFFMDNDNIGFSQGKLAKELYQQMELKNVESGRVMVTNTLKDLEENGFAYMKTEPLKNRPSKKIWYLTDSGVEYYYDKLKDL